MKLLRLSAERQELRWSLFFTVLFGATVDLAFFRSLCRVLSCGVLPSTIGRPRFGLRPLSQILSVASLRLF